MCFYYLKVTESILPIQTLWKVTPERNICNASQRGKVNHIALWIQLIPPEKRHKSMCILLEYLTRSCELSVDPLIYNVIILISSVYDIIHMML